MNPASNFWITGFSIPPINPIVPVLLIIAANAPTRNDPSCSLNVKEVTFGSPVIVSSTIANFWSG